jgi:hypothetical protein
MTYPDDWFARKVLARLTNTDQPDACWDWTGPGNGSGYGRVHVPGLGLRYPHRVTYTQLVGPIPAGLHIDHLCRNRRCANPAHLEPVTNRTNGLRGATISADQAARTHCPSGHPLSGDNLAPAATRHGFRTCRKCLRGHADAQRAAINEARHALGLTRDAYATRYGRSTHVAREIVRRLQTGETLDGVRDVAPGRGSWGKRTITIPADPTRA